MDALTLCHTGRTPEHSSTRPEIDFNINPPEALHMDTRQPVLPTLLAELSDRARARGLTDAQWAQRAGIRQETLSRLRRRSDCDLSTLQALAHAVGAQVATTDGLRTTPDGLFPATLNRDDEARLLALATHQPDPRSWTNAGPRFFMAGLAVMLAGETGRDRRQWLDLAEQLHPGASSPAVFALWLQRSPLRPSRFLPLLAMAKQARHAA